MANENNSGVYIMQVAAMLTGMHPQTLRKYERVGFLTPERRYATRLYSDEDIDRLKTIKHLVDDIGLNLSGVQLALNLRDSLLELRDEIAAADLDDELTEMIDAMLATIGGY
jgi:MerR family transcriptional regulator/heat shock protein HspR